MYVISIRPADRVLELKLSGLMTLEEIDSLRKDLHAMLDDYRLQPGDFLLLIDSTEMPIQPQPVHEALVRLGIDPAFRAARVAIWTGDAPSRMQTRRSESNSERGLFRSRQEAIAWLHGAGVTAAVTAGAAADDPLQAAA